MIPSKTRLSSPTDEGRTIASDIHPKTATVPTGDPESLPALLREIAAYLHGVAAATAVLATAGPADQTKAEGADPVNRPTVRYGEMALPAAAYASVSPSQPATMRPGERDDHDDGPEAGCRHPFHLGDGGAGESGMAVGHLGGGQGLGPPAIRSNSVKNLSRVRESSPV